MHCSVYLVTFALSSRMRNGIVCIMCIDVVCVCSFTQLEYCEHFSLKFHSRTVNSIHWEFHSRNSRKSTSHLPKLFFITKMCVRSSWCISIDNSVNSSLKIRCTQFDCIKTFIRPRWVLIIWYRFRNQTTEKKKPKQIQFELRLVVTYSRCQQYNKIEIGGRKRLKTTKQQQSCIRACALPLQKL